jgi:hypothetical protein
MNFCQSLIERVADVFRFPSKAKANHQSTQKSADDQSNPWQQNLARLAVERGQDLPAGKNSADKNEEQFNILIEQAQLEKAKEALVRQKEMLQNGGRRKRANDATVTDAKAWWGESLATWDPNDAKNISNYEQKFPQKSKWFGG